MSRYYEWIFLDGEVEVKDPKGFLRFVKEHEAGFLIRYYTTYEDIDEISARKKYVFTGLGYKNGDNKINHFWPEDEKVQEFLKELSKFVEKCEFIVLDETFPFEENIWKVVLNKGKVEVISVTLQPKQVLEVLEEVKESIREWCSNCFDCESDCPLAKARLALGKIFEEDWLKKEEAS